MIDFPPSPCPCSHWQHGCDESFQTPLEQLIGDSNAPRMFRRGQWVLHNILDIEICPDLMEVLAQIDDLCIREHDKLHARGGLVVMQFVFAGAVGEKGVVCAAELGDEVAQREDEAKDELLVVAVGEWFAGGCRRVAVVAGDAGP